MMYQAKNKMHGTHIVKFPIFFILVVLKINESSGVHKANRNLHAPHLHITYSNSESSESGANSEKCEKHEKSVLSSQSHSLSAKSMADLAFAQSANPHC